MEFVPGKKKVRVTVVRRCGICYDRFETFTVFSCNHEVCEECIKRLRAPACPFCRRELTAKDLGMKEMLRIKYNQESDASEREEEAFREFIENEEHMNELQEELYGFEMLRQLTLRLLEMPIEDAEQIMRDFFSQ